MLLMETNIQTEVYSHNQLGYGVPCLAERPSSVGGVQGGICMVTREQTSWYRTESMRFHGPNVVRFETVIGHTRTPLVGTYLPPSTVEHLPDFEEDLQKFKGLYPIALGYFNVELDNARILRSQRVADLLAEFSLIVR